ncbi:heterogeneous nuclear ribonucleoprotein F-like isoform X2 [Chrysoperla carnea]|uniref:heterogeneous nuclear ribonucleoprotein F-like isoform X2 n=1 Tax=Chrysoperla carnea TaxID=189513 RepID=UPI001D084B25|nr:heterogeneous nuclear ribonucleoprotein F-like isoform X2 [Chrysoperla carnea]
MFSKLDALATRLTTPSSASDTGNVRTVSQSVPLSVNVIDIHQIFKPNNIFSYRMVKSENMSSSEGGDDGFIVKLRGLPWSATVDEILNFFRDCTVHEGKQGIHMTQSREGRPSGEAYVELESEEDVERACKKDREHIGNRYIEVFKVNRAEMEWVLKRRGLNGSNEDGCVRLRGLPFGCSKEEIAQFFSGLEIMPNGITLQTDYSGRSTGEAYVQFVNRDVAENALRKHREKIGHRYIEIFRSNLTEVQNACNLMCGGPGGGGGPNRRGSGGMGFGMRPTPYDRGDRFGGMNRFQNNGGPRNGRHFKGGPGGYGGRNGRGGPLGGLRPLMSGGDGPNRNWNGDRRGMDRMSGGIHCVHMRGLPFRATESDVADFFKPLNPVNIILIMDNSGRPSGEADVEFECHDDAVQAMSKDKGHMQHRYIELFLNSSPDSSGNFFGDRRRH